MVLPVFSRFAQAGRVRRRGWLLLIVLVGLLGAAFAGLRWVRRASPYPCIASSTAGSLTAVAGGVLVRAEWGPEEGRLSVTDEREPVAWETPGPSATRAAVGDLLSPLATGQTDVTPGEVSLLVVCDGVEDYWRGEAPARPELATCWREFDRRYVRECVERWFAASRAPNEVAGALVRRARRLAHARGVVWEEAPHFYRPGPVLHPELPP